jgi:hypothetical protein
VFELLLTAQIFTGLAMAEPEFETNSVREVQTSLPFADGSKGFGLGVSIGEPTGIAVALRPSARSTFAGVLGWSLSHSYIHIHSDYLLTLARLRPDPGMDLQLEFFIGAGASIDLGDRHKSSPSIGIRFPAGIDLTFGEAPVDVFIELVPVMGLIPETQIGFDGALGIRAWFEPR